VALAEFNETQMRSKTEIKNALDRSRKEIATRAISETHGGQPFISVHCIGAQLTFSPEMIRDIHLRAKMIHTDKDQTECLRRCFADLKVKELEDVFDVNTGTLFARGAAVLAQRANLKLDQDEYMANLIDTGVADTGVADEALILPVIKERICTLTGPFVEKLRAWGGDTDTDRWKIEDWKDVNPAIHKFYKDSGYCKDVAQWKAPCGGNERPQ
jgi:hypothetical protein